MAFLTGFTSAGSHVALRRVILQRAHHTAGFGMKVEHRGLQTPVPCKLCNLVDVPARPGQVGEPKMAERVGSELLHAAGLRYCSYDFGPSPQGDWLAVVTMGLRQE